MKYSFAITVFLWAFIFNTPSYAWVRINAKSINEIAQSNLKFIASEQIKTKNEFYWAGEWPTDLYSMPLVVLFGVGRLRKNQEATAFTTASVVNHLGAIYADHPEFTEIPGMIAKATPTFERYREDYLYNFYPPRLWKGVRVHQPVDMTLYRIWKGFTNIPQDADTSSVTYTALYYNAMAQGQSFELPEPVKASFSTYRDLDRTPHYYNKSEKMVNTGAFMTWQFDENNPDMPRNYFAEPSEGTRIPFNRNDIDCVVNLNVLRLLALTNNRDLPGHDAACATINKMVEREQHYSCGIYYPNTYNLSYSIALAKKSGETCFDKNSQRIVEYIMKNQSADGGFDNTLNIWKEDRIQATAFAIHALAELGDLRDRRVENSFKYAVSFLLRNMNKSNDGYYFWPGQVFFTATALARSQVVWKSNSYTTATAMSAILKAQRLMPQYNLNYYLTLN